MSLSVSLPVAGPSAPVSSASDPLVCSASKRPAEAVSSDASKRLCLDPAALDSADLEVSFAEVRKLIQEAYADRIPLPVPQPRQFASLGEKELSSDAPREAAVVLPWSDGILHQREQVQSLAFPDSSLSGALRPGKFLPPFRQGGKHYPVLDVKHPTSAVPVNEDFNRLALVSGKIPQVSSSLSDADLQSLEEFPRRVQATLSTLDWLCGTLGKYLKEVIPEDVDPEASVSVPASRLLTMRRLLQSTNRSVAQVIRDSTVELANVVLRRRDAFLKKASSKLSEAFRSKLRTAGLFAEELFEPEMFGHAASAVKTEAELLNSYALAKCVEKVSQQQQQSQRPRQQQQQRSQQSSVGSQPKASSSASSSAAPTSKKQSSSSSSKSSGKGQDRPYSKSKGGRSKKSS